MKHLGNKIKNGLKIGLLTFFVSMFFLGGVSYGANDLLRQLFDPAVETNNIIDMGENVNTVGKNVFEGSTEVDLSEFIKMHGDLNINEVKRDANGKPICGRLGEPEECPPECMEVSDVTKGNCRNKWKWKFMDGYVNVDGITKKPSIIVKVTRLLLTLVITLSVTMILYNGLIYIVQTGQGKEGKSLVKNIVYIVIGIVLSLFSVVIITIIQSVPETIDEEVKQERNNETDNKTVEDSGGALRLNF